MIIEQLREQTNFTNVEKTLADYLLTNGFELSELSISDLAALTYTSPSTVTRFCKKLGTSGYKDFVIRFLQEYEQNLKSEPLNVNLPFSPSDNLEKIAHKMQILNENTIRSVRSQFNYSKLRKIARRMEQADFINIFAEGTMALAALDFQSKMNRLGYMVNLNLNSCFLPSFALASTDCSVNLLISQSGETRTILECAQIIANRRNYMVAITAHPDSRCASLADDVISMDTEEDNSLAEKIETFSSFIAAHYVLDCLYCFLFSLNYQKNIDKCRNKALDLAEVTEQFN